VIFSKKKLQLRAILRSADAERNLRAALGDLSGIEIAAMRGRLTDLVAKLPPGKRGDILLVDADLSNSEDLAALDRLSQGTRETPIVVTSENAGVDGLRQLMRFGIADYLPQPLARGEVLGVIEGVLRRLNQGAAGQGPHCTVLTFLRRTGGMGATSLAIQSAFELCRGSKGQAKPRICLVDLDFQNGAACLHLAVEPRLDIAEIARAPQRLDAQLLASMTVEHKNGFSVLAAPNSMTDWSVVTPEIVGRLMTLTCEQYDYVLVDMPALWMPWSLDMLAASDKVFVVFQLSIVAIRQVRNLLDHLKAGGDGDIPMSFVLNRYRRSLWRRGLKLGEVERALGHPIDFRIPSDYWLFSGAANRGMPISQMQRGSGAEKQIGRMIRKTIAGLASAQQAST
jgi:pilus assembly protein CpaE